MNLYAIITALLGILIKDAPVKTIEHVDTEHMILVTETHRVTIKVERLNSVLRFNGHGITNVFDSDSITWTIPTNVNGVYVPLIR